MMQGKRILAILSCVILLVFVAGGCTACGNKSDAGDKVKDLEFTIVEDADVPEKLAKLIEEKKEQPFKLSYGNQEYLYIVVGYGSKDTGGYSVQVNELYLSEHAICIDTDLIGPGEGKKVGAATSYPYIVVKTEYMDKTIVFQ